MIHMITVGTTGTCTATRHNGDTLRPVMCVYIFALCAIKFIVCRNASTTNKYGILTHIHDI